MTAFSKFMNEWSKKLMSNTQEYIVVNRILAANPQDAAYKVTELLNAGGEPDSITPATAKQYSVWFKDITGTEDTLTLSADEQEAGTIKDSLQERKDSGELLDFIVVTDEPYSLADALAYIAEKLEG